MDALRTYDYLMLVRSRVMDSIRGLSDEQYRREFPFALKSVASTVTHIMISEGFYVERMLERAIPPYEKWPIKYEAPPTFDVIEATWGPQATRVRKAIAAERNWKRTIRYTTFADDQGRQFEVTTSPSDIVTQLALHEVHHRAQIMAMLRLIPGASPVEDIDFNDVMYQKRPIGSA